MEVRLPTGETISEYGVSATFPETLWPSPEKIIPEMLPEGCVVVIETVTPAVGRHQSVSRDGIEKVGEQWLQKWLVRDWTVAEVKAATVAATGELIQSFTSALEDHYDHTAQSRQYDNRLTCTLRAGYPGPFQAEGLAFALWMDTCNAYGYAALRDVQAGARAAPSVDDLLAELPVLAWPQ